MISVPFLYPEHPQPFDWFRSLKIGRKAVCFKKINESLLMKFRILYLIVFIPLIAIYNLGCQPAGQEITSEEFLQEHIEWLSYSDREGRLAGTIQEADAANYIADRFLQYGLEPAGDQGTYFQQFTLSGPMAQVMEKENYLSRNVAGLIEGREHPGRYIIIGAHYDGQGKGGAISMEHNSAPAIHPSADDNASGIAGLLYQARHFYDNPPNHTILLVAFSGEEMGLLGSRYFVSEMEMPRDSVMAMINMDMIGRLDEGELTIFGTGTANIWDNLLESVPGENLTITKTPGGMGSSDHASFYEAGIPVLHYFSGIHDDYHRSTDTSEKINYIGMQWILGHIKNTVETLDEMDIAEVEFLGSTDPRGSAMRGDRMRLGVIPDYSYSGNGFRIESVRQGQPADQAGFENGDVVLEMNGEPIQDLLDYAQKLGAFNEGDEVTFKVQRGDDEIELNVVF